jgi:hypothetical protein
MLLVHLILNLFAVTKLGETHGLESASLCTYVFVRNIVAKCDKGHVFGRHIQNDKKFWEELIACFPLIKHGPLRKRKKIGGGDA